jgi:cold shock CspA family protein
MSVKKQGVVRSFSKERGFGIIRVGGEDSLERYFLHFSNIRSGTAQPPVGSVCFFEVSDKPTKREGDLPQAIRVDIIVSDEIDTVGGGK